MSLKQNIKNSEGFVDHIYLCSEGYPTVGFGFRVDCLSPDELACNNGVPEPMPIENADKILDIKIRKLINSVNKRLPWLESKPIELQEVVYEMGYQLGIPGLMSFKNTLRFMEIGNYYQASQNMLQSKWFKQTPTRVRRLSNIVAGLSINNS